MFVICNAWKYCFGRESLITAKMTLFLPQYRFPSSAILMSPLSEIDAPLNVKQIEGIWFAKNMSSLGKPNRRVKVEVERKPIVSTEKLSLADYSVTSIAQVWLYA